MPTQARYKVVTFLILTFVLALACYAPIVSARSLGADGGRWVFALMWSPGIAGLVTRLAWQRDLRGVGWPWGPSRYPAFAYLLPVVACLVVYGLVWVTGLGGVEPERLTSALARAFGGGSFTFPVALLIAGTLGVLSACVPAMGEELGWRGVLVPELAKTTGFTGTALWSGAIWAVYHYPAILLADYHAATPRVFSLAAFTVLVFAAGAILTWLRLQSGSVWPAVIFHGTHNLFVQGVFDRITVSRGATEYVTTEFGVGLVVVYSLVAIVLWRRRGELPTTDGRATRLHDFARRYTAAWCSQDAARVAAFFAPNGSLTINDGTPSVGRAAITEAAQGFMTAFPDMVVTMDELLDRGDTVIYRWTLSGANTGPGGTGKRVRISGYEEWRMGEDALVAESLGHFDSAEYQRQLEHGSGEGQ